MTDPRPDDLDHAGTMAMLTATIIAAMALTVIVAIAWVHHHAMQGRLEHLQDQLQSLQTFTRCDAPTQAGDVMVITVRHTNGRLLTRCQLITNPLHPERVFQ